MIVNGTVRLLLGHEVDDLLRYPTGRAERLARRNRLPHIVLPDGQIRFPEDAIHKITAGVDAPEEVSQ